MTYSVSDCHIPSTTLHRQMTSTAVQDSITQCLLSRTNYIDSLREQHLLTQWSVQIDLGEISSHLSAVENQIPRLHFTFLLGIKTSNQFSSVPPLAGSQVVREG